MGKTRICKLCRLNPATVADRNRGGRPVNAVCAECHAKRLRLDMARIAPGKETA